MTTIGFDPAYDDLNDRRNYCRHGRYIGSPGGPDYMCGYCESGDEPPTDAELAVMRVNKMLKLEAEFDRMTQSIAQTMREQGWRWHSGIAQGMVDMAETPYFRPAQGLYIYA